MVTTLFTPDVVSMLPAVAGAGAAPAEDDGDDGALGLRLARMMLFP